MARKRLLAAALLAAAMWPSAARAVPATCTVVTDGFRQGIAASAAGALEFRIDDADGIVFPMDVAADGSFTMTRQNLVRTDASPVLVPASQYAECTSGPPNPQDTVNYLTVGIDSYLHLDVGPPVAGVIDAGGNVVIPDFPVEFTTEFTAPECVLRPMAITLSTGRRIETQSGSQSVSEGATLDFATGRLTLKGFGFVRDAPGANGDVLNRLDLTCVLSPIPDPATLPAAAAVSKVRGVATLKGPLPDTPPRKPDKGDVLVLKFKLAPGGRPFDFAGSDLVLHLTSPTPDSGGADLDLVQLRVAAGRLARRGKRFVARDSGGTTIEVPIGQKSDASGTITSALKGSLTIVDKGTKGADVTLRQQGVDLSGLTTGARLLLEIGADRYVGTSITIGGGAKKKRLR
jgi:hypothetical protein